MDRAYVETVRLLLEAMPAIFCQPAFAMKGGTAINLFVEDMRRVSVDIDVVYTDFRTPRDQALTAISDGLAAARNRLRDTGLEAEMSSADVRDETKLLFRRGGLTPAVMECFVCYLAGHNRPVHEVLFSRDREVAQAFTDEFVGMTREPITLDELLDIRRRLRRELPALLSSNQREFLLGLVAGQPDWRLLGCGHLADLPALRWKVQNLARLKRANPHKFAQQADQLRARFGG